MLEQFHHSADQEVGFDERRDWIRHLAEHVAHNLVQATSAGNAQVRKVLVEARESRGSEPRILPNLSSTGVGRSCSVSRSS